MADSEIPYVRHPADFSTPVRYAHGPDSYPQPGVPRGTVLDYVWTESRVFPGTNRRYWVYVPAQYTASEPASLMVFQDGRMYLDPEGEIRGSIVFDNLIHRGELPVTIGLFIDPGEPENRNVEYDAFSDAYATFLLTEILPNVQDRYLITDDPDRWAIGGGSSGGTCRVRRCAPLTPLRAYPGWVAARVAMPPGGAAGRRVGRSRREPDRHPAPGAQLPQDAFCGEEPGAAAET